jgi:Secretion system C-terminal sorting domain/Cleaved Adhesin Domain/Fibronectin type III domain
MKKLLLILLTISISTYGQFTESFEASTAVPAGWAVIDGGDAANTWAGADLATSTGLQAQNGTKIFSIGYGATAHADYLITPQITVTAGVSNKLVFWARSRDVAFPEVISVKISTTTQTAAGMTVTLLPNVAPASGAQFYKYTADLDNYVGQNIYIGFYSGTTDMFRFDIDNVSVVGGFPSCVEPTSTCVVSAVGATTATVTWSAASPVPANGYEIYYSTSGTAPTNATLPTVTVAAGLTTNLTGLTQLTKYYLYVRSKCAANSSSVWGPLTVFNSFVDPISLPYATGFDNANDLAGWTISGNSAANMGTGNTAGYFQSPSQYWIFVSSVAPAAAINNWFYCRPISLTAGEVVTPSFWYRSSLARSLRLTVGNLNSATAQITVVYQNTTLPISDAIYTQITTPTFTAPTTGIYYFAFNDLSAATATASNLRIDTVSFTSVLSTDSFISSKFSVFPNPTTGIINVSNADGINVSEITVTDLNGRVVKTNKYDSVSNVQINISDLSKGMYMMNIKSDQGTAIKKVFKD